MGNHRIRRPPRTMVSTLSNGLSSFSFLFLVTRKTMIFKHFEILMCKPTWRPKKPSLPSSHTWHRAQSPERRPTPRRRCINHTDSWPLNTMC